MSENETEEGCSVQSILYGMVLLMFLILGCIFLWAISAYQPYTVLHDSPQTVTWFVRFDKEEMGFDYVHVWDHHRKRNRSLATVEYGEEIGVLRVAEKAAKVRVRGTDIIGWVDLEYLDRRVKK